MKMKVLTHFACLAIVAGTFPAVANAQHQNMEKRIQAMYECNVDGFLGYPSYEICVEQRYIELVYNMGIGPDGPEYHDPYGCSAESRMCPN